MKNNLLIPFLVLGSFSSFAQKPNIIIILADDQRAYGTIHALGGNEVITPNLDALVKSGITFTNSYIMGGSQAAVCAPSRNMLLTGRGLFSIGGRGNIILPQNATIGETLRKAGYYTYGIGKWHNDQATFNRTFQNGDEIFFGGMSTQFNVPLYHYSSTGEYKSKLPLPQDKTKTGNADHFFPGKHSSEIFSEAGVKFIQNYKDNKPFFLYVAFTAPHDPRVMPEKYKAMYDTAKISLPPNFMTKHPFDNGELKVRDEKLAGFPRTPSEIKIHIRDYYAMITHLDEQIGHIIQALKDKGVYENTIIVFAGDNGLALGQHGLMGKQNVYEHSVKVPLIIAGKNLPKGQTNPDFAYLFDIFPTICDLTEISIPTTVQGQSLFGKNVKPRNIMFYGYRDFQRAVRKGDWKLIEYKVDGKRTTQLFNLKDDPYELKNLAGKVSSIKELEMLQKELAKQQTMHGDTVKIQ